MNVPAPAAIRSGFPFPGHYGLGPGALIPPPAFSLLFLLLLELLLPARQRLSPVRCLHGPWRRRDHAEKRPDKELLHFISPWLFELEWMRISALVMLE